MVRPVGSIPIMRNGLVTMCMMRKWTAGMIILSRKDLSNLTLKGLCYAKNEIYARHGRKFKAKELQNYFNWQEWYDGIYEPSDATDKKIVKMLK